MSKLGFVLGFQSGPGAGGREGLKPSSLWFQYAKLYTLAAKRVASEFGIATVWTWGWGTFSVAGTDPDKQAAACVYLWTRDPNLCDGPTAAGTGFDDSLTEGQIALPQGVQCSLDGRSLRQTDLSRMTAVTHDRDVALHDPLRPAGRDWHSRRSRTTASRRRSRRSSTGSSAAAVPPTTRRSRRRGANTYVARAAVADELLRAQIEGSLTVPAPTEFAMQLFYGTYAEFLIRPFRVTPAAPWLGNRTRGLRARRVGPGRTLPAPVDGRLSVHHRPRLVHGHAARRGAPPRRRALRGRARSRSRPRSARSRAPRRTRTAPARAPSRP